MTDATIKAIPTRQADRIGEIDIIRGLALFGVLWMNLNANAEFTVPTPVLAALPTAAVDRWIGLVGEWLAQGKAQCLFSILFGFGFAILSHRAEARGVDARALYLRRVLILLVIGLAHLFLLWMGDILHAYALMGLALMLTRRWPSPLLLIVGLILALGAMTAAIAWYVAVTPRGSPPDFITEQAAGIARRWPIFMGHDYGALVRELLIANGREFYLTAIGPAFLATVLGRFMLGSWLFRQGWMQDTARYAPAFRRAAPWLLLIGLGLAAVAPGLELAGLRLPRWAQTPRTLVDEASQLVLALGYAAGIVVLCQTAVWRRLLSGLGSVGQMALTNYLSQSLVFVFVLYGLGLGWLKYAGPTFCLALALVVFAAQIVISRWWLALFRFGPAEWLWRSATYGRWQPLFR
ncbi:DUF418 domain-containing protein [Brevundimonas subvibrioides]|uniref:DUF418 domain-containing protein n=1 Tax=Brevundimonas subvibrioides TaxID=74313 RepID=UPI0022B4DAD3|nr:DUF418 domain-containing protein [Brevundimonas subvibrioides]